MPAQWEHETMRGGLLERIMRLGDPESSKRENAIPPQAEAPRAPRLEPKKSVSVRLPVSAVEALKARSVEEGRVRFEILRISEEGALSTETWRPRQARTPRPLP